MVAETTGKPPMFCIAHLLLWIALAAIGFALAGNTLLCDWPIWATGAVIAGSLAVTGLVAYACQRGGAGTRLPPGIVLMAGCAADYLLRMIAFPLAIRFANVPGVLESDEIHWRTNLLTFVSQMRDPAVALISLCGIWLCAKSWPWRSVFLLHAISLLLWSSVIGRLQSPTLALVQDAGVPYWCMAASLAVLLAACIEDARSSMHFGQLHWLGVAVFAYSLLSDLVVNAVYT